MQTITDVSTIVETYLHNERYRQDFPWSDGSRQRPGLHMARPQEERLGFADILNADEIDFHHHGIQHQPYQDGYGDGYDRLLAG